MAEYEKLGRSMQHQQNGPPWQHPAWRGLHRTRSRKRIIALAAAAVVAFIMLLHPGARYFVSESMKAAVGIRSYQPDVPSFKVSDSNGICKLEYTVKTYDGNNALVVQLDYVKTFTAKQHELGIFGAVGEIGVHHGKFLIPIVGNALVEEPAVALDLFEDQAANIDTSGKGSKSFLLRNLEISGIPENSITLMGGNSMQLSAQNFTSRGFPAFRLISVDGGHTFEITLHDLMVASCLVRDGGLVVLDDFPNPTWIGVAEALMHFGNAQDRLIPFLHGYNKVWFATASHVQIYRDLVASSPKIFSCTDHHESRRTVAGHVLCYTGPFR
eukprot:gene8762-8941_t